jgi:hypothetical protein
VKLTWTIEATPDFLRISNQCGHYWTWSWEEAKETEGNRILSYPIKSLLIGDIEAQHAGYTSILSKALEMKTESI